MGNMRFKVGDRVRIKSIDWYNKNKNEFDEVECGKTNFIPDMVKYCNKIVTISSTLPILKVYYIKENGCPFYWTDEMIECLVERNGKTYPYKIGDRVVLKGNNRCATITDLKYNSWGNLSYYIKIDNDKDSSIDYPTDLLLPYDNMVEELVEEETKSKPKFKVGDIIAIAHLRFKIVKVENDRYIVEGTPGKNLVALFKDQDKYRLVEEETKPIDLTVKGKETKERIEIAIQEGYKYVIESGKIIFTKKKKEYPKTYEECCKVLGYDDRKTVCVCHTYANKRLFESLYRLKVCRDAYWKIAGEEMGLGKPWEPSGNEDCFIISRSFGEVFLFESAGDSETFEFPTREIRDAFYENFKELINECKELL